jgi:Putative zincin peptidase
MKIALRWTGLSILLFLVCAAGIGAFYTAFYGQLWRVNFAIESDRITRSILAFLSFLGIFIGTIIVHELIHGLAFAAFGGNPRYGVGVKFLLPYAYVTAPRHHFSRNAFLVIGLAPLIVIDAIATKTKLRPHTQT